VHAPTDGEMQGKFDLRFRKKHVCDRVESTRDVWLMALAGNDARRPPEFMASAEQILRHLEAFRGDDGDVTAEGAEQIRRVVLLALADMPAR
jgi:hypothetical protein